MEQDNSNLQQQLLCDPTDLTYWSYSPLPSPESPFLKSPLSINYHEIGPWDPHERTFGNPFMTPSSIIDEDNSPKENTAEAITNPNSRVSDTRSNQISANLVAMDRNHPPESSLTSMSRDTRRRSSQVDSSTPQQFQESTHTMRPAWGRTLPSRGKSIRPTRVSGRRPKSYDAESPNSSKSSSSRPRLRLTAGSSTDLTSTGSSSRTSSYTLSSASPPTQTRLNHNQIEKQYRNRLNGQFETLLQVLPREETDGNEEKKISKAEVLVLAKKYIRDLEREKSRLEIENERLGNAMNELRREWVGAGGVVFP